MRSAVWAWLELKRQRIWGVRFAFFGLFVFRSITVFLLMFYGQGEDEVVPLWAPYRHVQPLAQFTFWNRTYHGVCQPHSGQSLMLLRYIRSEFLTHAHMYIRTHRKSTQAQTLVQAHEITHSQADVPIMRKPCLQPHSSPLVYVLYHTTNESLLAWETHAWKKYCVVTCQPSIFLSFKVSYCFPFSIRLTLNRCTFQKVPNTQTFHFQTQDSEFCLTNNHGSTKGSIILCDISITIPWRDFVDTKTANLKTKDFQKGGCRVFLSILCIFEVNAPLLQSAHCVLSTALLLSCFLMILADEMKVVSGFCGWFLKLRHNYQSFYKCIFSYMATLQSSPDHISLLYSTSIHNLCFCFSLLYEKILEVTFHQEATDIFLIFFFQGKFIEEVQAGESGIVRKTVKCTSFYLHLKKSTKKNQQKKGKNITVWGIQDGCFLWINCEELQKRKFQRKRATVSAVKPSVL